MCGDEKTVSPVHGIHARETVGNEKYGLGYLKIEIDDV